MMMKQVSTVIYVISLNTIIASCFGSAPKPDEAVSPVLPDEEIASPNNVQVDAKHVEDLVQEMLSNPHFSTPEMLKGAVPKNIRRFLKDPHKWSDQEIIAANKERRRQQLEKK